MLLQPNQSKPISSKKFKAKTTKITKAAKRSGHTLFYHFGDMCNYKYLHGMMIAHCTNTDKNRSLAYWVHYIRKRKAKWMLIMWLP
jgi:hypothetical protein